MASGRYALVGLGFRSRIFTRALLTDHRDDGELVALCDVNHTRMDRQNTWFAHELKAKPVPCYDADEFERMLAAERVDTVIVTSVDRTHHRYIVGALEHGLDVVTEKPLTTDAEKCQQILDAQARTKRNQPLWGTAHAVEMADEGSGGHGGGDRRLLADVFGERREPDPLGRAASHVDGAYAMLTGAAANRAFATGLPVQISDLVTFP